MMFLNISVVITTISESAIQINHTDRQLLLGNVNSDRVSSRRPGWGVESGVGRVCGGGGGGPSCKSFVAVYMVAQCNNEHTQTGDSFYE